MTSELRTKNGESSLSRIFSASFRGPAVSRGSDSTENSMLMLYFSSYYTDRQAISTDLGSCCEA